MMFISKFNAMIRNRFVWGAFAILVVIAFIGWGTQGAGESDQMPEAGVVDGQTVSADEFRQAYFNAYVAVVMAAGRRPPSDARTEQALKNLAWKRLASMRQADTMGLTVTDEEVATAIRQQPFFQQDGVFDPARYMGFINNVLGGMGVSESQFERFLAQEILLGKARRIMAAMAWVAPGEINQMFHQLYDEIKVGYVVMNLADMNREVSLMEDEVRRYFDENRESFKLPEQIRVKYVAVPHLEYLDPATVTDEEIQAYYDENIEDFTLHNDEGWSDAVPLDDVRSQIRQRLARERAALAAMEKAVELEMMLAPDRYGNAMELEAAVEAIGRPIEMTGYFSNNEVPPGLDVGEEFTEAAFRLRPTPEDYFSYPVQGDNACYILVLDERRGPRVPEFEEVRYQAEMQAYERAAFDQLAGLAEEVHDQAVQALEEEMPFERAFAEYGLEPRVTEYFSLQLGLEGVMEDADEDFYQILQEVLQSRPGELTELVPVSGGYALGMLLDRQPADKVLLESIRPELVSYVRERREGLVFDEWQNYLLADADLKNMLPEAAIDDYEDDFDDY